MRDANGRFSSSPGGGSGRVTGGSLKARSSARRSAAKLAGKGKADTSLSGTLSRRAQKAAATRTGKAARTARAANRTKLAATSRAVIRPGRAKDPVISKAASENKSLTRQRMKPPVGTPRKGQVVRALARAEANMRRGSAAVDKAEGRNNRNINRASAIADNLRISKPGSPEARKAKAAYDRLEKKINKGEKTRTTAANANQRLRALERAMSRGYGPTIAKVKVRAGGSRTLLEPAPGDRIKGGKLAGGRPAGTMSAKPRPAVARTTVMTRPEQRAP